LDHSIYRCFLFLERVKSSNVTSKNKETVGVALNNTNIGDRRKGIGDRRKGNGNVKTHTFTFPS
jgi:hypothetical protein